MLLSINQMDRSRSGHVWRLRFGRVLEHSNASAHLDRLRADVAIIEKTGQHDEKLRRALGGGRIFRVPPEIQRRWKNGFGCGRLMH